MAGRYDCVQLTDPSNNTNFVHVGKRTTGTQAGDYLITGPGWKGPVPPSGLTPIASPNNSVLVIGRVFVSSDRDLPTADGLATQMRLTPLNPERTLGGDPRIADSASILAQNGGLRETHSIKSQPAEVQGRILLGPVLGAPIRRE